MLFFFLFSQKKSPAARSGAVLESGPNPKECDECRKHFHIEQIASAAFLSVVAVKRPRQQPEGCGVKSRESSNKSFNVQLVHSLSGVKRCGVDSGAVFEMVCSCLKR